MRLIDDEFLTTADAIGTRICRDALWAGERCNWIGAALTVVDGAWQTVQGSLGADVYGGTSGVALFLARLAAATGDRVHRMTALGAIRHAIAHADRLASTSALAFYSGRVGVDYASIAVGEAVGEDRLIERGLSSLEEGATASRVNHELDVVSGFAGAIPALLSVHRRYDRPALRDLASNLGHALLRASVRSERGVSWPNPAMSPVHHLTGYSHGAAGFALALAELYAITGNTSFLNATRGALSYERAWYDAEQQNWPDLREYGAIGPGAPASATTYGMAWCHGAPGIGLSRMRVAQLLPDELSAADDARVALSTTTKSLYASLAQPSFVNFSLCHGLAGNAELPLVASTIEGSAAHRSIAEQVGRAGIALYERISAAWPSGITGGGETPGLMLGSAGMGYFYLRLADTDGVPPVLMVMADADARAARTEIDRSEGREVPSTP